jgi:hypothetical protein
VTKTWAFIKRNVIAIFLVLVAASVLLSTLAVKGVSHAIAEVNQEQSQQLANRAHNVHTWCTAINANRDYNRRLVREVGGGRFTYSLPDLPCVTLESDTRNSTR